MKVGVSPYPAMISVSHCKICNLYFSKLLSAQNHFISRRHRVEVQSSIIKIPNFGNLNLQRRLLIINQTMLVEDECFLCLKKLPGEDQRNGHLTSNGHQANVNAFFNEVESRDVIVFNEMCILCNVALSSKEDKSKHVSMFPHLQLCEEKVNLLKRGITEDYLKINSAGTVDCFLCNAKLLTPSSISPHLNGKTHLNKLKLLNTNSTNLASLSKSNGFQDFFYCPICDKSLDGTTESEKHYTYPGHLKMKKLYCFECNIASVTEQEKQAHDTIFHHELSSSMVGPMKVLPSTISTSQYPKNTTEFPKSTLPSRQWYKKQPNNGNEKQIFDYLNLLPIQAQAIKSTSKLANPLQFPKIEDQVSTSSLTENRNSLPFSKIKKQLPSLLETSDPLQSPKVQEQQVLNHYNIAVFQSTYKEENRGDLKEDVFRELEKLVQTLYYSKQVPYDVGLKYLRKFNKELEELADERLQENDYLPQGDGKSFNYDFLDNIEERMDKKIIEAKQQCDPSKEPEEILISDENLNEQEKSSHKKCTSDKFNDLLDKISSRKAEVDWNSPLEITEKELLDEIEHMVKLIKEGTLPPDKLLECLISFNTELDGVSENKKTPPPLDLENDMLQSNVIACLNHIALHQTEQKLPLKLISKIRDLIDTLEKCDIVLNLILQKAVELGATSKYVELIEKIEYFQLKHPVSDRVEIRTILQSKCWTEFNLHLDKIRNNVDDNHESLEKSNQTGNSEIFFGFMQFLGNLFNHGLFTIKTLKEYMKNLRENNDLTSLRAFCVLYSTVHHELEFDLESDVMLEMLRVADGEESTVSDNLKTVMDNLIEQQWTRFSYIKLRSLSM